jgi:hypothetical protein
VLARDGCRPGPKTAAYSRAVARLHHLLNGWELCGICYCEFLGVALPAILISVLRRHSLGHDATAAAFTAAQAFHEGGDRRVKLETETHEIVSRQTSFVPTMQATQDYYAMSLTQPGHRSLT